MPLSHLERGSHCNFGFCCLQGLRTYAALSRECHESRAINLAYGSLCSPDQHEEHLGGERHRSGGNDFSVSARIVICQPSFMQRMSVHSGMLLLGATQALPLLSGVQNLEAAQMRTKAIAPCKSCLDY